MENKKLIDLAIEARKNSYCPYSNFAVGAALLCKNGKVYTGCNIENAAFGPGNCAERTAIFKAVSEGDRAFEKIAIAGSPKGKDITGPAHPCGVCRQVMQEFVNPAEFKILVAYDNENYKEYTLKELFPEGFGPDNL
ncbi:MAG: cytidine deaminase [Lachnospiraceae bacterium]|jgi:cytidine deaminase|nr:cytidine deaminase [Lachnospiraceae bacterium]